MQNRIGNRRIGPLEQDEAARTPPLRALRNETKNYPRHARLTEWRKRFTGQERVKAMEHSVERNEPTRSGAERKRVEAVVETLANLRGRGESLAEVAHDARNMVTALGLYCDLLEEPGVLSAPFLHYGSELRLVATASRRLVEKLMALDAQLAPSACEDIRGRIIDAFETGHSPGGASGNLKSVDAGKTLSARGVQAENRERWNAVPPGLIGNLAGELLANRNLLAALAGPSVALTVDAQGCSKPVRMTGEDLTRILVNLVKNASEAIKGAGRISLSLSEGVDASGHEEALVLAVEDNGPGIPAEALETIFQAGYTTKTGSYIDRSGWAGSTHRGLGLSIVRAIVEEAGGRIHAANRGGSGARIEIELPVRDR